MIARTIRTLFPSVGTIRNINPHTSGRVIRFVASGVGLRLNFLPWHSIQQYSWQNENWETISLKSDLNRHSIVYGKKFRITFAAEFRGRVGLLRVAIQTTGLFRPRYDFSAVSRDGCTSVCGEFEPYGACILIVVVTHNGADESTERKLYVTRSLGVLCR